MNRMAEGYCDGLALTDVEDPTIANTVLANGARFYVDHAHPEYATPEVTDPLEAARHDAAGYAALLADDCLTRVQHGERAGSGHTCGVHKLGDEVLAQHWADRAEPVRAGARERGGAGALELDLAAGAVGIGDVAEQQRAAVAQ